VPAFDVKPVPDPLEDANLSKPGWRGVFLINHMMDSVEFSDGGRQVMMRKHPEVKGAGRE
jgi:serine/threonine-protein kinase RsbW